MTAAPPDGGAATVRLKVISVGSSQTGKSCLIKRFCENKFVPKYVPTIGVDYGVRPTNIKGRDIRVNFFDLSGADPYVDIRTEFYKDAHGAALVFGLDDRASFEKLEAWMKEARDNGAAAVTYVLIGNKSDAKRAVSTEEAKAWADDRKMPYFEVSASTGQDVTAAFETLFVKALDAAAAQAEGKTK